MTRSKRAVIHPLPKRSLPASAEAYLDGHLLQLRYLQRMWEDPMVQCYEDRYLPKKIAQVGMVMLLGPTSRNFIPQYNWRSSAYRFLRQHEYHGWIAVPEPRGGALPGDFTDSSDCHLWESTRLFACTDAMIWICRDSAELLGMNTNLETGIKIGATIAQKNKKGPKKSRTFIGWPDDAPRVGLINHYCKIAGLRRYSELEALCKAVADAHNAT